MLDTPRISSRPRGGSRGVLVADLTTPGPGHGLEELVADPELEDAVAHEHVAGAAPVVLADTDLLPADADHAVRATRRVTHCSPVAPGTGARAGPGRGSGSPAWHRRVIDASGLCCSRPPTRPTPAVRWGGCEIPAGVELDPQGAMEALDLAGCGRRPWLRQQVLDAVVAADPVEEYLHRGLGFTCR